MDNFNYYAPTKYVFGRDTEAQAGQLTRWMGCRKILLVLGGGSARCSGLLDRVAAALQAEGVEYLLLEGIKPNPTDDRVYEGIDLGRREKIDGLLAVGGGSVIDTAKAIAAGIPYDGDFWDFWAGMERYFSPTQEVETTDRIAEGLLMAIIEEAPKVMADPENYQARANIMWAGTMAHNGVAGCGRREDWTSHGLEHELSALYGVTHGAGLAVVFPAWMTFMASHRPEKVAQLGRRVFCLTGKDDSAVALQTVDSLRAFFGKLGLPLTLSQLGIENPDIALLTAKFHEDKGTPFGPYFPLQPVDTAAVYRLML